MTPYCGILLGGVVGRRAPSTRPAAAGARRRRAGAASAAGRAESVLAVIGLRPSRVAGAARRPRGRVGTGTGPRPGSVSILGSAGFAGPLERKLGIDQRRRERVACGRPGDPPRCRSARPVRHGWRPPRRAGDATAPGTSRQPPMPAPASRVLFLGLDGGTMTVFGPWFERGLLPNLAALWRRSAFGHAPLVRADGHAGRLDLVLDRLHARRSTASTSSTTSSRPTGRSASNHAGRVRVPTLWQVLSAAGREVVSLNLPMTYPPPRVRGLVVAGSDAPGPRLGLRPVPRLRRRDLRRGPRLHPQDRLEGPAPDARRAPVAGRAEPGDLPRPGRGRRAGRRAAPTGRP